MITSRNKKILIVVLLLFVLVIAGILMYRQSIKGTLDITSEPGSTISIALERGGEFEKIGESPTSYVAYEDISLYVRSELNGSVTITPAEVRSGETVSIELPLQPLRSADRIAQKALSSPLIQGEFVYGVNNQTGMLDFAPTAEREFTDFAYFSLPQLQSVGWKDRDNFLYSSGTVGRVVNTEVEPFETSYISYSANPNENGSFFLLSGDGVFRLDDVESGNPTKIASLEPFKFQKIFASESQLFLIGTRYGAPPEDSEGIVPEIIGTELIVMNYDGTVLKEQFLDIREIVVEIVDDASFESYIILTESRLVYVDKQSGNINQKPIYLNSATDMLMYDDELVILGSDGLWSVNLSSSALSLLSKFPDGEEYVSGSLTNSGNSLVFSSQKTDQAIISNQAGASSSIYILSASE